jgi:beta-glucosidase-like glycosyl hydrolase/CubicO group peptidase (beta-lactamase class C family)
LSAATLVAQDKKNRWVDSVFQTMKPQEKVSQLFMLPVAANARPAEIEALKKQVKDFAVGGIYITKGSVKNYARLANQLQANAAVPLLIGINAEWGLGQTLDSAMNFQKPLVLGSLKNDSLIYALGTEVANQMKALGLHINFAPHANIQVEKKNPFIALRYFGDNKISVSKKSVAFMKGLQDNGIIACAKHLPAGEGSSEKESKDNVLYFDANRLDTLDFYPYQKMIDAGLKGLLTSHLQFSTQGKKGALPASVSELFINDILKKKIGFKGLTFSEIPYLQSVGSKSRAGDAELLAFSISNDVLIAPLNIKAARKKILKAIKKNVLLKTQFDLSVKKILAAKYDVGLDKKQSIKIDELTEKLNTTKANYLKISIAEASVTVVKNDHNFLPIQLLDNKKFAAVSIGDAKDNEFNHYLSKYAEFDFFNIKKPSDTLDLKQKLNSYSVVVIAMLPSAYQFQKGIIPFIKSTAQQKETVLAHFGNPYSLKDVETLPTIISSYTDEELSNKATAELIFGGIKSQGQLPVNVSPHLPYGKSISTTTQDRFSYTVPEAAGMDSPTLNEIETIANEAITSGATPGCQVFVARHGKVVYEKSFGYLKYDKKSPVTDETIYDLASVTKVAATLQAVMFMFDKGLIDINKKISVYLPELKKSNKKDFIIKDILTHQAGLWPFLPFWAQTLKDSTFLPQYYSRKESVDYPFAVSENLFSAKFMKDSLWQWIIHSKVVEKTAHTPYNYKYSDMGFYIMQHLAEKILNQPQEAFLEQNLYHPLGAYTTGYLPLKKFNIEKIAPTEDDKAFRKVLLIGYVHDQGAAMHGGIAGHAGLFSTANDLGKLGQLWLQKGHYGGLSYFKPETIELFTNKQYETSRRGLGWDKPTLGDPSGPTSLLASFKTFGHTGFTGTCVWVDPEYDLVYIFLSNRVHPDMNNTKLLNANIRPRIQEVVYKSIANFKIN